MSNTNDHLGNARKSFDQDDREMNSNTLEKQTSLQNGANP